MIRDTAAKGPVRRPRVRTIVAVSVVGALVVAGGVFGVNAVNAYRADIEAMQTSAQAYYDAAADQQALAQEAADKAQGYAAAASASVDSIEAAEAEAAAIAEAAAAAAAAAASQDAAESGPVKCPAGSQANSADGPNDTSCFPNICFSIAVPDPSHPECDVAFKP
jgi:hypothetical protein